MCPFGSACSLEIVFSVGQSSNGEFAHTFNGSMLPSMGSIIIYVVQMSRFVT